jgi:hypothetical protein
MTFAQETPHKTTPLKQTHSQETHPSPKTHQPHKTNPSHPQQTHTSGKARSIIFNFIRFLLILAFITALMKQRWLLFTLAGLAFLITFLPNLLREQYRLDVPAELDVLLALAIYGSLFLSEVRGAFASYWWWDILLNALAAIALGFIGLTILTFLYKEERLDASPILIAALTFAFAFSIGSLWEILEFFLDTYFSFSLQQASLHDTMTDLLTNALGALAISVLGYHHLKKGRTGFSSGIILSLLNRYPQFANKKKQHDREQKNLLQQIREGESETKEFKTTLRTNLHTNQPDKAIELAALKTIAAFMNTKGGTLLIGVNDQGEIIGTEQDHFPTQDKMHLHTANLITQHLGKAAMPHVSLKTLIVQGKNILKIKVEKSHQPNFLLHNQDELFYVRHGPASVMLKGRSLLDYINNHFN